MALAAYNGTLQDSAGNAVAGTLAVRRESDNALASVYSDRDGATPATNPITVAADGAVLFYAAGGAYKLVGTTAGGERTLRHVAIGLAAETDFQIVTPQGTWDSATTYEVGDLVSHEEHLFVSLVDANLNNEPDAVTPGDTASWMLVGRAVEIEGASTTSLIIETGTKVFTTQAGRLWSAGARLRAASDDGSKAMIGVVDSYSGVTLTLTVDDVVGAGTHADWNISIAGERGVQGVPGPSGSGNLTIARFVVTSNIDLAGGDLADATVHDGVTAVEGDIALVVGQTAAEENGFWIVPNSGAAARAGDFGLFNQFCGIVVSVIEGTSYGDTLWLGTTDPGGMLDTDPLEFSELVLRTVGAREVTAAGAITMLAADDTILVNKASGAPTTVNLVSAATRRRPITVKDLKGDAAANAITLTPDGSDTIDGLSSWSINFNGGAVTLWPLPDGSGWYIN